MKIGPKILVLTSYFPYNISMKEWFYKVTSGLLSTLVVLASADSAWAQKQLKYVPQTLKTPNIPAVINPRLPLDTRIRLSYPVLDKAVTRNVAHAQNSPVTTAKTLPSSCPQRFVGLLRWLDDLQEKHLIAAKENTSQAVLALRNAIIHYDELPAEDKPIINGLAFMLGQAQEALTLRTDGLWVQLVYSAPLKPGQLPRSDYFYLRYKKDGFKDPFFKKGKHPKWTQSFYLYRNRQQKEIIEGIMLFQKFTPQETSRELQQELSALLPKGYHVRMGPHELGLYDGNRTRFREGKLHLHIEADTPTPGIIPTSKEISLWLSAKPYAGAMDMRTRQIILPNNDTTIARNYLTLFEPFLNEQGRAALQAIIEEEP